MSRNADEARSELAHELKTPLAVIAGYAELLRQRDDERTRLEAADRILEAVERLSGAIEQLLGTARTTRIAIVEDYEPVRNLLRDTFPAADYELLEAHDGDEAIELVVREPVDLVILDWNLPKRPGAEVLAELKLQRPELRVVVLSGDRAPAAEAADAVIAKPFSPADLLEVVGSLLGR